MAPVSASESVRSMVSSLARRGPDSEGLHAWPGAVLGHRRLAILDLSDAGKQPMISDDGQIGLVFNGCIYNFQELRRELEAHGHRFHSNCDTEVLLLGYRQWGIDALVPRLRGMFAFAVWDDPRRRLTLVRDRLGVKPLVYAAQNGGIGFASTIPALQNAGLGGPINPDAVLEFLEFGWVSDNLAIFEDVHKVPAAGIVEWQDGRLSHRCYWTPPQPGSRSISFDQAVDETESLLLEAAKLRLISDVPVGALLSGGIDSALIAWAMAKLNANIKCFTVATPGHPADESADAAETARILGVPHEIVQLPPDQQPPIADLTAAYGEPFACSSALAMLQVCKAVKPKVTVLLTGDGGDDVFLGYAHHRNFWHAQRLSHLLPGASTRIWPAVRPLVASVSSLRRPMHLMDYAVHGLGAVTRTHDGLPYYVQSAILGERLTDRQLSHRQIPNSFHSARNLVADMVEYERRNRFVAEYMTKVDGGAMHYAIEARSPFLDHKLWELAASLPVDLRLRRGELKAVLRALVRRNIGPQVAARRKQGFTVPVTNWLVTGWKPQLEALCGDSTFVEQQGWVKEGTMRQAITAALARGRAPVQLWTLIVLENWLRQNTRAAVAA